MVQEGGNPTRSRVPPFLAFLSYLLLLETVLPTPNKMKINLIHTPVVTHLTLSKKPRNEGRVRCVTTGALV
jgi:hypothetical protein